MKAIKRLIYFIYHILFYNKVHGDPKYDTVLKLNECFYSNVIIKCHVSLEREITQVSNA